MKINQLGASLALTLMVSGSGAALAAPRDDYYRDRRPSVYRNDGPSRSDRNRNDRNRIDTERERRETLRSRLRQLTDVVQAARRRDRLSDRERRSLIDRLDKVGNFLRHDRNLSEDEFRRRMHDLDSIQDDLRRASDRSGSGRRDDNRRDDSRRDDSRRDDSRYRR
jgi:hypothetical protein